MAGYIGSKASVVSSGAERKKTFTITGATTSLTGLNYTVGKVHVFQNGVRLVDGTDYTATNGTSITLTVAAQSGDNVVVISQAAFQVADALLTSGGTLTGDLTVQGAFTSQGIDDNGNATALTIDSNENVLVGTTSSNYGAVGTQIGTGGNNYMTRSAAQPLLLNRLSSDGDILLLMKDGASVGSIGVAASDNLYIAGGSGNTKGLYFSDGGTVPANTGGAPQDNTSDLGAPTVRFKDLYLGGGVYLGGTGSANKLSSYEEGSWTPASPAVTFTQVSGRYIKVGSAVHLHASLTVPSTSSGAHFVVSGFPFAQKATDAAAGFYIRYTSDTNFRMFYLSNGNNISSYNLGGLSTSLSQVSGKRFDFSGVYYTDA